MCLASIYDMSADVLIAHLESLLRERRAQQSPSPAATATPPGGASLPHVAAGEPSLNAPRRTNGATT